MTRSTTVEMPGATDTAADDAYEVVDPGQAEALDGIFAGSNSAVQPAEEDVSKAETVSQEPEEGQESARRGNLKAALKEERAKRKIATDKWRRVEEERARLEAELAARRRPVPVSPELTPEEIKAIREEADKAASLGDVAEIVARKLSKRHAGAMEALLDQLIEARMENLENLARLRHPDYDRILQESGVLDGLRRDPSTGAVRDPALARAIFSSKDPAEEAYQLALEKLQAEGRLEQVERRPVAADVESSRETAPARQEPRQTADAVREAERRVIEKVVDNTKKPRGIGALPAATPAPRRITREQIDKLADEAPDKYRALMDANPDLRRWYLGG